MPEPQRKLSKARLLKMFVVDDDGNYGGEYTIDEECKVEFADVVKIVGNSQMTDMQSIPLDEFTVTAMHGSAMNLIAVSIGPLSTEELMWAKTTLTAAGDQSLRSTTSPKTVPDKKLISELEALRERVGGMESQLMEERRMHEEEKEQLRKQLVELSSPPPPSWAEQEAREERKRLLEEWRKVEELIAGLVNRESKLQQSTERTPSQPARREQLRSELPVLKKQTGY